MNVSIENKSNQVKKKRMNIWSRKTASSIWYCAFIYLFFSVFSAFDLWLKCYIFFFCYWFYIAIYVKFSSRHSVRIHMCTCLNVFYGCNVHVTVTMWILDFCVRQFSSSFVIDAVANDTLQNTCEHGNNHAFNFKFTHRHMHCIHPLAWYGQIKCWIRDASKGNSTCSLPCNTFLTVNSNGDAFDFLMLHICHHV